MMNEKSLEEIASRIIELLREYEIDYKSFQVMVQVSEAYYDQIKSNFKVRNPIIDAIVGTKGENWNIDLMIYALGALAPSNDLENQLKALKSSTQFKVMNDARLEEFLIRIKADLDTYRIDIQNLTVGIFVRRTYYEKIKRNFKNYNPTPDRDVVVGSYGKNWAIQLLSPPTLGVPYEDRFL